MKMTGTGLGLGEYCECDKRCLKCGKKKKLGTFSTGPMNYCCGGNE